MPEELVNACCLIFSLVAAIMDLSIHKVKNIWIYSWMAAGFFFRFVFQADIWSGCLGLLFPILFLGIFFFFGMMGAGDVKLFSVLGIWMGLEALLNCMFVSFLIAAFFAVFSFICHKNAAERFLYLQNYLRELFLWKEKKDYGAVGAKKARIPLALPAFMAVIFQCLGGFV